MIKIDISVLSSSGFERWKAKAEKARDDLLIKWRKTKTKPSRIEINRNKNIWIEFKNTFLKKMHGERSSGKCAYCEADISVGAELHVEHYRPKGGVSESFDLYNATARRDIDHEALSISRVLHQVAS